MVKEWELGFWEIPNVKANHPEKTLHPCQFPIELVERCVFAFTNVVIICSCLIKACDMFFNNNFL